MGDRHSVRFELRTFPECSSKRSSIPWSPPAGCSVPTGIDVQPDRNTQFSSSLWGIWLGEMRRAWGKPLTVYWLVFENIVYLCLIFRRFAFIPARLKTRKTLLGDHVKDL
jgi:hypothetical protein